MRLEYDEFDTVRGDVYVTGPIADGLRFSVAALAEHTDGFVKNVTLGRDELERDKAGGRITLRADLSERLDATLYIDGVFERGGFYGDGEPLDGQPNATPNHRVVYDQAQFEDLDNYGGSLNINYDLGFAVLTSITALRKISSLAISDLDNIDTPDRDGLPPQLIPASIAGDPSFPMPSGNYTVIGREQSIISEELRLASTGDGPFQWLVGLYGYMEENDRSREQRMPDSFRLANPGNFVSGRTAQDRKGFAAFGQATYTLWERLDLTAGLRFATEKDEQTLAIEFIAGGGFVQNEFGDMPEETFSDITPMGSVTYRWNDEVMTYVTIAKGFKGGGFNLAGPARLEGNQPFDSEKSLMYELGSKLSLFDNRMTLGLALFQIDTNDMQVTTTVVIGGGQIVTNATTNAAKARSRGFELEFEAVPAEGFTLSGAVGYTDAEYVTFMPTMTLDLSGQPIEEVPDWTANLNAEYAFPVGSGHSLAFGLSYQFVGGRLMGRGLPEEPHINVESFDSVDIRATLGSETWDLTVYGKNVLDSYNIVARNIGITFFDTPGLNGTQRANPPRQLGVKGTVRF